jgi:hypothetical protein
VPNKIDITNKRFGRLVALRVDDKTKYGQMKWLCKCDCGNEKSIIMSSLTKGRTFSCGCYHRDTRATCSIKHGMSKTPEYTAWQAVITRATNKNFIGAKNYSKRGIGVCARWLNSFDNFIKDMGKRPSPNHSIERVNNDKGYYPSNCVWATRDVQNRNKRSNIKIEIDGVTKCLSDWLLVFGKTIGMVAARRKRGMSIVEALTSPQKIHKINSTFLTIGTITKPIKEWSELYNITTTGIRYRLSVGWDVESAIKTPSIRRKA